MSKMESMYTKWKTTAMARNRKRGNEAMMAALEMRRVSDGRLEVC
jgi:hypothetical protein